MSRATGPPWHYLRQASVPSLQSFELSRLNHAAHLRKQISALIDEWIEELASALLARWLLELRLPLRNQTRELQKPLRFHRDLAR